jgi:hypothetical protein
MHAPNLDNDPYAFEIGAIIHIQNMHLGIAKPVNQLKICRSCNPYMHSYNLK